MTSESQHDARMQQLASDISALVEWANVREHADDERDKVRRLLEDWLGEGAAESVIGRDLPGMELVNLQVAINTWSVSPGRTVDVRGVYVPRNYGGADLMSLMSGHGAPARLVAPAMTDLPDGYGSTLACYERVFLLVRDARGSYAVYLGRSDDMSGELRVEIAGLPVAQAQAVLDELDSLRDALDVHRGGLLQVRTSMTGDITLEFLDPTPMPRERLILPEVTLKRVEQHTVGVAQHREQLLAAGQHLKRGVLLYGPPGTGKTHTIRYVLGQMEGYTRLIMQGAALHAIASAADLARRLAPAVVVLEDVDLVAQDRSFDQGDNPILFELLDAMDGAAADSDLLFILTTNRAEVLERALAARPGRVDVAVEIERPDAQARRKLFELYAARTDLEMTPALLDEVSRRTEGVTASFLKELVRRCVLTALQPGPESTTITADDVTHALDDMLDDAQHVTRALLGSGGSDAPDEADEADDAVFAGQGFDDFQSDGFEV